MNDSGDAVGPAAGSLHATPGQVLVVHDELDLPFGTVRGKVGGGARRAQRAALRDPGPRRRRVREDPPGRRQAARGLPRRRGRLGADAVHRAARGGGRDDPAGGRHGRGGARRAACPPPSSASTRPSRAPAPSARNERREASRAGERPRPSRPTRSRARCPGSRRVSDATALDRLVLSPAPMAAAAAAVAAEHPRRRAGPRPAGLALRRWPPWRARAGAPLLAVTPGDDEARDLSQELTALLGRGAVALWPTRGVPSGGAVGASPHLVGLRARAIASLGRPGNVIVASARGPRRSASPPTRPPSPSRCRSGDVVSLDGARRPARRDGLRARRPGGGARRHVRARRHPRRLPLHRRAAGPHRAVRRRDREHAGLLGVHAAHHPARSRASSPGPPPRAAGRWPTRWPPPGLAATSVVRLAPGRARRRPRRGARAPRGRGRRRRGRRRPPPSQAALAGLAVLDLAAAARRRAGGVRRRRAAVRRRARRPSRRPS